MSLPSGPLSYPDPFDITIGYESLPDGNKFIFSKGSLIEDMKGHGSPPPPPPPTPKSFDSFLATAKQNMKDIVIANKTAAKFAIDANAAAAAANRFAVDVMTVANKLPMGARIKAATDAAAAAARAAAAAAIAPAAAASVAALAAATATSNANAADAAVTVSVNTADAAAAAAATALTTLASKNAFIAVTDAAKAAAAAAKAAADAAVAATDSATISTKDSASIVGNFLNPPLDYVIVHKYHLNTSNALTNVKSSLTEAQTYAAAAATAVTNANSATSAGNATGAAIDAKKNAKKAAASAATAMQAADIAMDSLRDATAAIIADIIVKAGGRGGGFARILTDAADRLKNFADLFDPVGATPPGTPHTNDAALRTATTSGAGIARAAEKILTETINTMNTPPVPTALVQLEYNTGMALLANAADALHDAAAIAEFPGLQLGGTAAAAADAHLAENDIHTAFGTPAPYAHDIAINLRVIARECTAAGASANIRTFVGGGARTIQPSLYSTRRTAVRKQRQTARRNRH